ncbi:uncharacterized protein EAF02_000471 [Botrytis sinoallii]|uniref:uncharacterized protein n=1 Tax=Botrytis sinoallii TaxID=1463999 RepID=UPI0018FF1612|nr:uncharacterized protein EAF02_000471 [Botrytis sinoallii]KAF7892933.1 hypothetical protein EAF02_000471 [Botrytis sinoallii]
MFSKPHFEVYSLSTSGSLLSTELIYIFDSRAERSTHSLKFLYHESASLPIPLPTLTQTSVPSSLEYLGYIRGESRVKRARALAKNVQRSVEQPFKRFTNDVIEIWIKRRLLLWDRDRTPCEVDDSILDEETLKTRDKNGGLSKYAKGMIRHGKNGDYDSSFSSSSSSSLASTSPSQLSLGRSTRESHRRLSRARTTHNPPSSTHSWSSKSSSNPPKRFSFSVSLSANSSSNPRHKSSPHSRSHSRSRAPPSSYHDQNSDYDSGIGMSEDKFNPHDDDDAKSSISYSSINPGSSISHSDRSSSSSHSSAPRSSHRAHPKKDVSPAISDLDDQRKQEDAVRDRIFRDKKAELRNSSSSPSSSRHPPPSSSGSGSQSRSRAQSRRSQTPTHAFHAPRSSDPFGLNDPFRLSGAGEPGSNPWIRR